MTARSEYDAYSMHREQIEFTCSLIGAGTSDLTLPASSAVHASDNFASSGARSAAGTYAVIYKELFPAILHVIPTVVSSDGASKEAIVTSIDLANKTINVKVRSRVRSYLSGNVAASDPASINAGATGTCTLAVTGAQVGDTIFVHPRALDIGLVVQSYSVTAPNVVTVTLYNPTAAPVDGGVQTYEYALLSDILTDLATTDTLKITVRARKNPPT